jgi:hypothetical protein
MAIRNRFVGLAIVSIAVLSICLLGSVTVAGAETMKCRMAITRTVDKSIPASDQEGHVLGVQVLEGLSFFDNGEVAKTRIEGVYDQMGGATMQSMGYNMWTFEDGSTIMGRFQRTAVADKSGTQAAKASTELIKGTGRFAGIKGTTSSIGRNFLAGKDEAYRVYNDVTFTYTLPPK